MKKITGILALVSIVASMNLFAGNTGTGETQTSCQAVSGAKHEAQQGSSAVGEQSGSQSGTL